MCFKIQKEKFISVQYDSNTYTISGQAGQVGGWYLTVSATNNAIYTTLSTNTQYNNVNFTQTTFLKRIPDPRDLQDRTYRVRYVIDKDKTNPLPRDPISGFVMQPLNTDTTSYALQRAFYIYDIEIVQAFERGVNDGIYYLTLLCASIAPSTSNFDDRKFSPSISVVKVVKLFSTDRDWVILNICGAQIFFFLFYDLG